MPAPKSRAQTFLFGLFVAAQFIPLLTSIQIYPFIRMNLVAQRISSQIWPRAVIEKVLKDGSVQIVQPSDFYGRSERGWCLFEQRFVAPILSSSAQAKEACDLLRREYSLLNLQQARDIASFRFIVERYQWQGDRRILLSRDVVAECGP